MKLRFALFVLLIAVIGCKPYKELKPNPMIAPVEGDYILLSNKSDIFELKKDKQYFMQFPGAPAENFYLVLKANGNVPINAFLTQSFKNDKKASLAKMTDKSADRDVQVYTVSRNHPTYYWVIDRVSQKTLLNFDYRYVPIWRYRFETKNAEFQRILAANLADRSNYQGLGTSVRAEDLDLQSIRTTLTRKNDNLKAVQGEMLEIEAIFPSDIRNSNDRAYQDYLAFRSELDSELQFQENYLAVVDLFALDRRTRNRPEELVASVGKLLNFFELKDRYPANVLQESRRVIGRRLPEIAPHYDNKLRSKRDADPIDLPVDQLRDLYRACGTSPNASFNSLANFVEQFNRDASAANTAQERINALMGKINAKGAWPDNNFYPGLQREAEQLPLAVANSTSAFGKYAGYPSVSALVNKANLANSRVNDLRSNFGRAASLVPAINADKARGDFQSVIRTLNNNSDLGFLLRQYPDVDKRSLTQQEQAITAAFNNRNWAAAEQRLQALYEDQNFLDLNAIAGEKRQVTRRAEDNLVSAVEQESRQRVDAFIEQNKSNYRNVEGLYNDPAFTPVHVLTWSSGGPNVLERQNQKVQQYIDGLKFDKFPKMAIENIYRDFVRDVRADGVAKAKAVIIHGTYYKGDDRRIKNLIAECNPSIAKWITKAKDYRKIYVVPVNDTQQSSNEYLFRLNLQIPSDARFPVFDINMKLPRELAKSSESVQWFETIKLNGNLLKNEGRFSISAPTSSNNYEAQIAPLQVKKEGNNILEVRFKHSAFKVLEVSVMGQRSLIKRD